jgi:hypothetical protein
MRVSRAWLVAMVLLAGCATTEPSGGEWTKAGATAEQMKADRTDCLMQAQQVTPSPSGPRMRLDSARFDRCMSDRGYTTTATK